MLNEHGSRVNVADGWDVGPSDAARRYAADALSRIGRKWRLHVLWSVAGRPQRFNELLKTDDSLSSFMLSQALRDLEADGLVVRKVMPSRPPFTAYQASAPGRDLLDVLAPLIAWASAHPRPSRPDASCHHLQETRNI